MEKLTYKQAFDKITEAYIKGEIKPFELSFCFCGTLAGNVGWKFHQNESLFHYKTKDFLKMEAALFEPFKEIGLGVTDDQCVRNVPFVLTHPDYEETLFNGMCAALEILKQIHKERGENVEDFEFVKRETLCQK